MHIFTTLKFIHAANLDNEVPFHSDLHVFYFAEESILITYHWQSVFLLW